MQESTSKLIPWMHLIGLSLSPNKSTIMEFCRKHRCLKLNKSYFLGLILTGKYTSIILETNVVKTLIWPVCCPTLIGVQIELLYWEFATPYDYASIVYFSAPTSYIKHLDPLYNKGIRLALRAFHTSPAISQLQTLNYWPLCITTDFTHPTSWPILPPASNSATNKRYPPFIQNVYHELISILGINLPPIFATTNTSVWSS